MNFDDPKLTAYALGELESAEDRAAVEALLRDHPELSAELDETRAVAEFLRRELKAEDGEALTPAQREDVLATASVGVPVNGAPVATIAEFNDAVTAFPWWRRHWIPSAVAATVILTTSIATLWNMQQPRLIQVPLRGEEKRGPASAAPADSSRAEPATAATPPSSAPLPETDAQKVQRFYAEALNFKNTGRYDLAFKRTEQILNIDSYHIAARKLQEEINKKRDDYAANGYNHTLSAMVWQVDKAWDRPVRKFASTGTITPASPASSSSAASLEEPRNRRMIAQRADNSVPLSLQLPARAPQSATELTTGRAATSLIQTEPSNTESYDSITDNAFLAVRDNPLSTFSIDVDTANYSNVRRFLTNNQRPPKGAVRIEELVNYFPYAYPQPQGEDPFSCTMEVAACPWTPQHRLVRVGLKGREIAKEKLPPSNLVFLIDVSGSMRPANKLPLVKECMQQLVSELREQDSVGMVVYAGSSGTVLEPTSDKAAIRAALDRLEAGGSTNGASGLQSAYDLAQRAFKKEGNNRVILCTDGDFNVGVTSQSELVDLIQRRAKGGVFLSVLGFGMGNTKDSTMEKLADKGNGNYAYIDSLKEGRKVLVDQMAGTLFTIAKDVKIQVEFNPANVGAYRLIGYENRLLTKEDFNDDTKDAGEIGAGHTVTALYEVVPAGVQPPTTATVDPLKYQQHLQQAQPVAKSEILTLKLRFKQPDGDKSVLREFSLTDNGADWEKGSTDFRWSAAVASFGMLLRDSPHRGNATWDSVAELANDGKGADTGGYRTEFMQLIDRARQLVPITPLHPPVEASKGEAASRGKAASLVVSEFDLNDTPILDAIDALAQKSRELDPEKKGVSIVFAGGNNAAQLRVTLRMRNTSVLDTARAIATTVGVTLQEQGDILILKAGQQ